MPEPFWQIWNATKGFEKQFSATRKNSSCKTFLDQRLRKEMCIFETETLFGCFSVLVTCVAIVSPLLENRIYELRRKMSSIL